MLKRTIGRAMTAALCIAAAVCILAVPAFAADEQAAAKAVFDKYHDTVITVKAVVKVRVAFGGQEQYKDESEVETLGTVLDASGLTVVSFSSIDPSRVYDGLMKQVKSAKQGADMDLTCDITSITMILPDDREVAAGITLKDADLDIALIKPSEAQEKPFAALDISGENKADVLDTLCLLGRLDRVAGRSPSVKLARVESVITSPRRCYVADSGVLMSMLGAPAFSPDGKVVGISLLRISRANDQARSFMSSGMDALGITPVVLPASEVKALADQALHPDDE